jgi:transposase
LAIVTEDVVQQIEDHLLVDSTKQVARLEVLEGPTGRRRWSELKKARIVAESYRPGVLVRDVARRHGLAPQHLSSWRRLAREGKLVVDGDIEPTFAALVVAADPPPTAAQASPSGIEIEACGVIIRLPGDTPAARLAEIATALARSAGPAGATRSS